MTESVINKAALSRTQQGGELQYHYGGKMECLRCLECLRSSMKMSYHLQMQEINYYLQLCNSQSIVIFRFPKLRCSQNFLSDRMLCLGRKKVFTHRYPAGEREWCLSPSGCCGLFFGPNDEAGFMNSHLRW
jgi:hypothetical protein